MIRIALATVLCLALLPVRAELVDLTPDLRNKIEKATRRGETPGVAVAIIENGRHIGTAVFGVATRGEPDKLTSAHQFPIGSAGQLPLAMLALMLSEQGKLDLHAPIGQYLPADQHADAELDLASVRIHDLLTHHAGLPSGPLRGLYSDAPQPQRRSTDLPYLYAARPPRQVSAFSLVGSGLLRDAMEAQTGSRYADLLHDAVLAPLDVTVATDQALIGPVASGHEKKKVLPRNYAAEADLIGQYASVDALARLGEALLQTQGRLSAATRAGLLQAQNADVRLDFGNQRSYGLYLRAPRTDGMGQMWRISPDGEGFRGEMRGLPDHGFGVLVLANGSEGSELVNSIVDGVLESFLTRTLGREISFDRDGLPDTLPVPAGARLTAVAPAYATPGGLLSTDADASGFDFELAGLGFRASRRDDGWYRMRYRLLGFVPIGFGFLNRIAIAPAEVDGRAVMLGNAFGTPILVGTPVRSDGKTVPIPLGSYRLSNPDAPAERLKLKEVRLKQVDGQLVAEYDVPFLLDLQPRMPLSVRDDQTLQLAGLGPLLGERIWIQRDAKQITLNYAGYLFVRELSP